MNQIHGLLCRASRMVTETFFPGPSQELRALHDATDRVVAAAKDLEKIVGKYDKIGGVAYGFRHPLSRRKKVIEQ